MTYSFRSNVIMNLEVLIAAIVNIQSLMSTVS
jgi:hypothetical protein